MESRHCGQDKRIFFCPVHNASTPCSLQAFGIRCILLTRLLQYQFQVLRDFFQRDSTLKRLIIIQAKVTLSTCSNKTFREVS